MKLTLGSQFRCLSCLFVLLAPATAFAQAETEPNDNKAQANLFVLPLTSTAAVIQGNSTSAAATGLDYFLVMVPERPEAGFYRHRLIATSAIVGHTLTLRGLNQVNGVPGTTDTSLQTSSSSTTPPRFVQWYTSQAGGTIYVRATGGAITTSDYALDYEVQPVIEIVGPKATPGEVTIDTVAQSAPQTDTDFWVYDSGLAAIPGYGNDDHFNGLTLGSTLTRTYVSGTYHLAISNFNVANDQVAPNDDDFDDGALTDFSGSIVNSSTAVNLDLDSLISGVPVAATKTGPYDVVFVRFGDLLFADDFESGTTAAWSDTVPP